MPVINYATGKLALAPAMGCTARGPATPPLAGGPIRPQGLSARETEGGGPARIPGRGSGSAEGHVQRDGLDMTDARCDQDIFDHGRLEAIGLDG